MAIRGTLQMGARHLGTLFFLQCTSLRLAAAPCDRTEQHWTQHDLEHVQSEEALGKKIPWLINMLDIRLI